MSNYYSHQDDCIAQMAQPGPVFMPTGTGKGEIISRHNYNVLNNKSQTININVIVAHRILLSQQLLQRAVQFFMNKGEQPNFRRICVHSGDQIEYGTDKLEEEIWLAAYPDDKCGSLESLTESIQSSINLGHDVVIATTYHSLHKTTTVLNNLGLKANVSYLDEIHRGVAQDDWYTTLKEFVKACDLNYGFTATPGKQRSRIESLLGDCIYYMDSHTAIQRGLICKPVWMIVDVDGNKQQHIAKGVVKAFEEHQQRIKLDAKMLVHCTDTMEIATIGDSKEIKALLLEHKDLIVAEISSSRGARINGAVLERLDWLERLNKHQGKMIVLHIDICNSGLDVPGFTFGLWNYMSASETYATQGNGRSGRVIKADRERLERGEITAQDYSQWEKPYNICGLLNFNDSIQEDEDIFVDFVLRSREQGFDPEDIIFTGTRMGTHKSDPFSEDGDERNPFMQSRIQVAINVRLENEARKELHHNLKKLDPMSIFGAEF